MTHDRPGPHDLPSGTVLVPIPMAHWPIDLPLGPSWSPRPSSGTVPHESELHLGPSWSPWAFLWDYRPVLYYPCRHDNSFPWALIRAALSQWHIWRYWTLGYRPGVDRRRLFDRFFAAILVKFVKISISISILCHGGPEGDLVSISDIR